MLFRAPVFAVFALALLPPGSAQAQTRGEVLTGPIPAQVERVVDGDTLAVRVRVWLGQDLRVLVRLRGIDAPERRGACADERRLAGAAADYLSGLLAGGRVTLTNVSGGKYHGRVLADVAVEDGGALAPALIAAGLARPYAGRARASWCGARAAAE